MTVKRTKPVIYRKKVIPRPRQQIPLGRRLFRAKSYIPRRIVIIGGTKKGISLYKRRTPFPHLFKRFQNPFQWFGTKYTRDYESSIGKGKGVDKSPGKRKLGQSTIDKKKQTEKWQRYWKKNISDWMQKAGISPNIRSGAFERQKRKPGRSKFAPKLQPKEAQQKIKKKHPNWGGLRVKGMKTVFDKNGNFKYKYDHYLGFKNEILKRKFGDYPKEIDDVLIVEIKPTAKLYHDLKALAISRAKTKRLLRIIQNRLDDFRDDLLTYARRKIDDYVPKRTGRLRDTMYGSLEDCKRLGANLKIKMSAKLPYAGVVQKMPAEKPAQPPFAHLRHYGEWQRGYFLYDPKAQTTSFNYIKMILKGYAKKLWREFLLNLQSQLGYYKYKKGSSIKKAMKRPQRTVTRYRKLKKGFQRTFQQWDPKLREFMNKIETEKGKMQIQLDRWIAKNIRFETQGKWAGEITISADVFKKETVPSPLTQAEVDNLEEFHGSKRWTAYSEIEKEWIKFEYRTIKSWFKIRGLYRK